ncbi:hypothetical protein [Mailhella sp.]|uniref:hypothetical protein n=1 Tax=Mailhella sp. TaxID=1981029 RepID=UPI004064832C
MDENKRRGVRLEDLVTPMLDPWAEGRLPKAVTMNAFNDGGMGMPEEIDDIEYYRLKIASLYDAQMPKKEKAAGKGKPSLAEPVKPERQEVE